VPFSALVARVGGYVDVLRHTATEDTTTFVDVVFDLWTQDGFSFWALYAKRLALFFVFCTIETGQTGRGKMRQSIRKRGGEKMNSSEEMRHGWRTEEKEREEEKGKGNGKGNGKNIFCVKNHSCKNY
jgi:hypothetical protein